MYPQSRIILQFLELFNNFKLMCKNEVLQIPKSILTRKNKELPIQVLRYTTKP